MLCHMSSPWKAAALTLIIKLYFIQNIIRKVELIQSVPFTKYFNVIETLMFSLRRTSSFLSFTELIFSARVYITCVLSNTHLF